MKIVDLKCAVIGGHPVIRILTDEGIVGTGQVESSKPYLKPHVLFYRDLVLGMDPTDVERVMLGIRRLGGFKPWGSAVSAIEMALWDIAGKAAGIPVYKLLGGKIRDRVRVYLTGSPVPVTGSRPEEYAAAARAVRELPQGFTLFKMGVSFHSSMPADVPGFFYGEGSGGRWHANRGPLTERGLKHVIACAEAMKQELGDEVGLALDCGPGMTVPDSIRLARAVEPLNLMWLEDMITGDYVPYVLADLYREVTRSTSTPIHTGEQIYLRQHFKELFEKQAVNVVGPDPADVGGIAETKWIAEYAGPPRHPDGPARSDRRALGPGRPRPSRRHPAAELHRLRDAGRVRGVLARHGHLAARPDRRRRPRRGLGHPGPRGGVRRRGGEAAPVGRGCRFLRLVSR